MEPPSEPSKVDPQPEAELQPNSAAPEKREKDPLKRQARKQNKRQKYKERQAQKQTEKSSDESKTDQNKHLTSSSTAQVVATVSDEFEETADEEEKIVEAPKTMSELLARIQEEEAAKNARARELLQRAELDKMTPDDFERVRDKKRVYSAWIGDYGDQNKRAKVDPVGIQMKLDARSEKDPKQHRGLRCKKCFCLLARDEDFEYRNGMLWLIGNQRGWDGLSIRGENVFCQNNHRVGHKVARSYALVRTDVPVIKPDKTTWEENFVRNPEFAGSDFIKNKPLTHV
eukprot:TRINITY_DN10581_c0_g1_i1.p1 TRINITY_DN10581_c0_g1~~TRINITY_DN10581_c0_g1_i1.p1  ORF type:complete len:286 (-),score=56.18 TRINITY_DN10581_c0_g1_i1:311-1168(-)